ncbi:MAG: rod shape-determining protein MreD [Lawsonibacter sp.]|jgi:rod shape-determining protein MreD
MTRRDLIHKWSVYTLALFFVWIVDAYLLPRIPLAGFTPVLLPVAAVSVAVLEGAYAGTGFGLAVGLLWEMAYPGGFGGLVFFLALTGAVTGGAAQYALSQSLPGCMVCCAGALAALEFFRIAGRMLTGLASLPELLWVAGPEFLLSLAWTPVIYFLFRCVYRRVGGTKLA